MKHQTLITTLALLFMLLLPAMTHAATTYHYATSWTNADASGDPWNFRYASGMVTDSQGNVYVSESPTKIIKVFNADGELQGQIANGFTAPRVLLADAQDNIWVYHSETMQKYNSAGELLASLSGEICNQSYYKDYAVGADGTFYLLHKQDFQVHVYSPEGVFQRQFSVPMSPEVEVQIDDMDAWLADSSCNGRPEELTVDTDGNIIVKNVNRVMVFDPQGSLLFSWKYNEDPVYIGCGGPGGAVGYRSYDGPYYIDRFAVSHEGLIYLPYGTEILAFTLQGELVAQWESRQDFETVPYNPIQYLQTTPQGRVYISSSQHVAAFTTDGQFLSYWSTEANGVQELENPDRIVEGANGVLYITDTSTRMINAFSTDGALLSQWCLNNYGDEDQLLPKALTADAQGNLYVTNKSNKYVQQYDSQGAFINQWQCPNSDQGLETRPGVMCLDGNGYIYVADDEYRRILKLSTDGQFITAWGHQVGAFFDGPFPVSINTNALPEDGEFSDIKDIAIAPDGSVVTLDSHMLIIEGVYTYFHRIQVFTPDGQFLSSWNAAGDGPDGVQEPTGLEFDSQGALLVVDSGHRRMQAYTLQGEHLTSFGQPVEEEGALVNPTDAVAASDGKVYVVDRGGPRVMVYSPTSQVALDGVATGSGSPVNAMILANGKFTFSSSSNGAFSLNDVPLDNSGQIVLQVFCDGFEPYVDPFAPSQERASRNVTLNPTQDGGEPLSVTYEALNMEDSYVLQGQVRNEAGDPLSTLVLANGQSQFTSAEDGAFALTDIVLDQNGHITLFVFCQGAAPYKQVITP